MPVPRKIKESSNEDRVDASLQRLEDYIHKCGERLIKAIKNNTDNTIINKTGINRKEKWKVYNSMDSSSDKQTKSDTRKFGHG